LPIGCAAIGKLRAPAAGILIALMAADTPAVVREPPAVIAAPASRSGDQPREQLDSLLGIIGSSGSNLGRPSIGSAPRSASLRLWRAGATEAFA
jgi:hypothetical protein